MPSVAPSIYYEKVLFTYYKTAMKVVIVGSGAQGTGLAGLLILGKDVEQQFIPGGSLAYMCNFIVQNHLFR